MISKLEETKEHLEKLNKKIELMKMHLEYIRELYKYQDTEASGISEGMIVSFVNVGDFSDTIDYIQELIDFEEDN